MAFTMVDASGPVLSANVSGELSKSEVGRIQAAAREAIRRCGKISALFILQDFQGWQREAEWGDDSFLSAHDKEIEKIAVVGENKWRDFVYAFLAKGFRHAEVEFFPTDDLTKARAWLTETSGES
jgi:stage II sporulation SpoAA-like protein